MYIEVAVQYELRSLNDWLHSSGKDHFALFSVTVYAGSSQVAKALENWFVTGTPAVQAAATSLLAEDIHVLGRWLSVPLALPPFSLPMTAETFRELPFFHMQVLAVFEEFRHFASPVIEVE